MSVTLRAARFAFVGADAHIGPADCTVFQKIYGLLRSRETGEILSMAPNFDMLPASENIDTMFAETFDAGLRGIGPDRAKLYRICEENDVGITVMKGFAGGRLFDEKRSPFGVRLSPVQCITTR